MSTEPLLTVEGLKTHFHTEEGTVKAVDGVDFDVRRGETVAIVGESGSGKTVTSESVTKIIDIPPGEIAEGSVTFDGMELSSMSSKELQSIRGERISTKTGSRSGNAAGRWSTCSIAREFRRRARASTTTHTSSPAG